MQVLYRFRYLFFQSILKKEPLKRMTDPQNKKHKLFSNILEKKTTVYKPIISKTKKKSNLQQQISIKIT